MAKQFKPDVVFPERPEVKREPGEDFWGWWDRQCQANAEWSKAHKAAINDPKNMTTEYLTNEVVMHDAAKIILAAAPFEKAREAARETDDGIEKMRRELARRMIAHA